MSSCNILSPPADDEDISANFHETKDKNTNQMDCVSASEVDVVYAAIVIDGSLNKRWREAGQSTDRRT